MEFTVTNEDTGEEVQMEMPDEMSIIFDDIIRMDSPEEGIKHMVLMNLVNWTHQLAHHQDDNEFINKEQLGQLNDDMVAVITEEYDVTEEELFGHSH